MKTAKLMHRRRARAEGAAFAPLRRVALVGMLAAPLLAGAQPKSKVYMIGFLGSGTSSASAAGVEQFREGMRELGWVEGKNITVEYRFAEGRVERLPDLAAALVQKKVDLIVALPSASTVAAHKATRSIPIVAVSVSDPVGLGLATSLALPGGNFTGLTFSVGLEIWAKQLQLLKEAVPTARRFAALSNPGNPGQPLFVGQLTSAARSLGVSLQFVEARAPEDFDAAFAAMARERADALVVIGDPLYAAHADRLAALSLRGRLPTMHTTRVSVAAGGLMAYAPDLVVQVRQAAAYVDKILKGAKPGDLPFEQPTKFDLVINLKTAKAMGLALPQSLLLQANQVLE